jgi:hypothetical protein
MQQIEGTFFHRTPRMQQEDGQLLRVCLSSYRY